MKFLPENRKKTIWALILLAVSAGGTIYLNFFMGKKPAPPPSYPPAITVDGEPAGQEPGVTAVQPVLPTAPSATGEPASSPGATALLPYGSKFDTGILESNKFKALRGVPRVDVTLEELGKLNPFQ